MARRRGQQAERPGFHVDRLVDPVVFKQRLCKDVEDVAVWGAGLRDPGLGIAQCRRRLAQVVWLGREEITRVLAQIIGRRVAAVGQLTLDRQTASRQRARLKDVSTSGDESSGLYQHL